MNCDFCGNELNGEWEACPVCGAVRQETLPPEAAVPEGAEEVPPMPAKKRAARPRRIKKKPQGRGILAGALSVLLGIALLGSLGVLGTIHAARNMLSKERAAAVAKPAAESLELRGWLLAVLNEETVPVFSFEKEDVEQFLSKESTALFIRATLEAVADYMTGTEKTPSLTKAELAALLAENRDILLTAAARRAGVEANHPLLREAVETAVAGKLEELEERGLFSSTLVQETAADAFSYIQQVRIALSRVSLTAAWAVTGALAALLLFINRKRLWRGFFACSTVCFAALVLLFLLSGGVRLYVGYMLEAEATAVLMPMAEGFCSAAASAAIRCGVAGGVLLVLYALAKLAARLLRKRREQLAPA